MSVSCPVISLDRQGLCGPEDNGGLLSQVQVRIRTGVLGLPDPMLSAAWGRGGQSLHPALSPRTFGIWLHLGQKSHLAVSCHSMLPCSVTSVVSLWIAACQAPLSMGFSRQEYWSGLPFPPPGDPPHPGIKPVSLMSPALVAGSLPLAPNDQ